VNPLPQIPVRRGTVCGVSDYCKVFTSEFSIPSAVSSLNAVKELAVSDVPHKRVAYEKILKSAAALALVSTAKGPYKLAR
jgi:hypothetical protein